MTISLSHSNVCSTCAAIFSQQNWTFSSSKEENLQKLETTETSIFLLQSTTDAEDWPTAIQKKKELVEN